MAINGLQELVVEHFRQGWPVSVIDRKLRLEAGTARRLVVAEWKADKERAEAEKLRRVYKHGGGSAWLHQSPTALA